MLLHLFCDIYGAIDQSELALLSLSDVSATSNSVDGHDILLGCISTQDPNHVLRKLPEARLVSYHLRPRVHGFQLPTKDDRHFIPCLLYKDIY